MTSTLMATQEHAVQPQTIVFDRPSVIASDRSIEGGLGLMTTNLMTKPRYAKEQIVCFVGGAGTILSCRPDSDTWIYVVEMELGPEPDMGRVGSETTVLLDEADIQGVLN